MTTTRRAALGLGLGLGMTTPAWADVPLPLQSVALTRTEVSCELGGCFGSSCGASTHGTTDPGDLYSNWNAYHTQASALTAAGHAETWLKGLPGDTRLLAIELHARSYGGVENIWPFRPYTGTATCTMVTEFDLLQPARVLLNGDGTAIACPGEGIISRSLRATGPTGTLFERSDSNVNDPEAWGVNLVLSLPIGSYRAEADAFSQSQATGSCPEFAGNLLAFSFFVPRCANGQDDDGDGLFDLDDPGCTGPDDISEEADCSDGADNDADGLADLNDPGCADASDLDEHDPTLPCDDGADNDSDLLADLADPGCQSPTSPRENPQCQDGLDNDGQPGIDFDGGALLDLDQDGFIDLQFNPATPPVGAPDPQCTTAWRNREAAGRPGCGLGFELALVLGLLARPWAGRRMGCARGSPS